MYARFGLREGTVYLKWEITERYPLAWKYCESMPLNFAVDFCWMDLF